MLACEQRTYFRSAVIAALACQAVLAVHGIKVICISNTVKSNGKLTGNFVWLDMGLQTQRKCGILGGSVAQWLGRLP